jgi:hypothetical protein
MCNDLFDILLQDEHERIRSKNQPQYSIDPLLDNETSCRSDGAAQALHLMNAWDDYKSMDYTQCVSAAARDHQLIIAMHGMGERIKINWSRVLG